MVTAISPTGVRVQYNDATYVIWGSGECAHYLMTAKDGYTIAAIPTTWAVEFVKPCAISSPPMGAGQALDLLLADGDKIVEWSLCEKLADLKRLLQRFNIQQKTWRKN